MLFLLLMGFGNRWCEKAAKQGLKWAQETLSIMYFRGIGTDNDSKKCEYWYRVANQLESADSYKKAFFTHLRTMTDSYPIFRKAGRKESRVL